jgi:uncharacterized protein YjbI with pentapeptide repeats/beta-lactamase regulating signal transducer with metallopeptidase domain
MDMQALENIARSAIVILVNSVWQGAAIALVTWLALRAFPRVNASTRYAAWTLALIATLVVPVATSLSRIAFEAPQQSAQAPQHAASKLHSAPVVATPAFAIPQAPALHLDLPALITSSLFALWALAVLALIMRLAVALLQLERLKRDALPLRIEYRDELVRWQALGDRGRDVRICVTDGIEVPVAVGLFDAMVLLPQHLLDRLDAQEIDQVSLHELAHLLRHDDWSNGFQRLVAALLFFNPAVWFIARQMDIEREVACDDYVLELTGAVRSYAYCLTKMAEITTWPHQPLAAPGVFVTRKNISIRIERLLRTGRAIGSSIAPATALAVIAGLALAILVARAVTPVVAFAMPQIEPSLAASPQAPASASPMRSAPTVPATSVPASVAALAHAPVKVATERSSEQASFSGGCQGCDFANARLGGRDFSNQNLGGSNFANADLHGARFDRSDLNGTNFSDANLRDVSFVGANMTGCDLSGADVTGARFDRAVLTGCSVDIKRLSPNQAMQFLVHCTGCDFSHADLNGLDLHGLQITGADLSHVNLRDANLSGTTFKGVDFSGADFGGANLNGTTFYGCDLSNVDLSHVDISHATFFGTSLGDVKMKR